MELPKGGLLPSQPAEPCSPARPSDTEEGSGATPPLHEQDYTLSAGATPPLHEQDDYTCPICLELLLRPVKLSCDHRFCRDCWARVLQGRDVRATARLTGGAACPYRCEVKPVVPEVDQTLATQLESHFAEYRERASSTSLPDEERRSTEVNEWAAQGCELDTGELAIKAEEAATARAARVQEQVEERLRDTVIIIAVVGAVLLLAVLGLMLMTTLHPQLASRPGTMPVLFSLTGISAAFVLLDALLAWRMMQPGLLAVVSARLATPPTEGDTLLTPRHFVCGRLWSRMITLLCCFEPRAAASSSTSTRASIRTAVRQLPQEHAPPGLSEIAIAP